MVRKFFPLLPRAYRGRPRIGPETACGALWLSLSKGLKESQYRANPETANPLSEYAEDIQAFCKEVLGIRLYRRQLEIVEAVPKASSRLR